MTQEPGAKHQPSRRDALTRALKGTAYVAPAVVAVSVASAAPQVSGSRCTATLALEPSSSTPIQFASVRWIGSGYTPHGTVRLTCLTILGRYCDGFFQPVFASVTADSTGRFDTRLPKTILSVSVLTDTFPPTGSPISRPTTLTVVATDVTTGCVSPNVTHTLLPLGSGPADSMTLANVPGPLTSPLAPVPAEVPGENGSGVVILGHCASLPSTMVELRFTLSGATPNRTFAVFLRSAFTNPLGFSNPILEGSVITDAAGHATFARYFCYPYGLTSTTRSVTTILALTIDGNPPLIVGHPNVAYQSSLLPNDYCVGLSLG